MLIPGLPRYRPLSSSGFKPVTFTNNGTFVVPDGVEQVRIVGKGRDAVGTWVSWSQHIRRMNRQTTTDPTGGPIPYDWDHYITPAMAELSKFQGLGSTNGQAVTFTYHSVTVHYRYGENTPEALPLIRSPATDNPTTRTWRFRNGSISYPNFTGMPTGTLSIRYGNWPSSPLVWLAEAQRYEFVGYGGGFYTVTGSVSGQHMRFRDPSSLVPSGGSAASWPVPQSPDTIAPVSTEIVSVVPGETLTLSFPSGAVADRYIRIEQV